MSLSTRLRVCLLYLGIILPIFADQVPPGCSTPVTTCTQPGGTRTIAGMKVTLPCWQYQAQYTCGTTAQDTCQAFEKSCQLGPTASCERQIQGYCVNAMYTYECPTKQCDTHALYCAHDVFCIDGQCAKQTPTQNKQFGQAASELDAVATGAKDAAFEQNGKQAINLFSGHAKSCAIDMWGYKNCCQDKGWGKEIGLVHCSDSEKKLGKDKEHYLATYVGEFCAHHTAIGHICTSHHKVYCVFDSKLARIVSDYGRAQLHKSYGSPDSPNCSGFSMDEFQRLDFDTMDFVDPIYIYPGGSHNRAAGIANDRQLHGPSPKDMNDAISKRIHEDMDHHTPSSDVPNSNALANAIAKQVGSD